MAVWFIDMWFTPPWLYLLIIGGVAIVIYWFMKSYYYKEEIFEIEQFKDVVLDDLDDKFKSEGIRSKCNLMRGIDYLGKIDAWINLKGTHETMVYSPAKKMYVASKEKPISYDLYLLRMPPRTFFDKYIFREKNKYFLIDKKQKHFDKFDPVGKSFNIKEDVQMYSFGGCYVTSESGEEWITDISIKRSNENTLTYLMNYSRKIIYLELAHSKVVDKHAVKMAQKREQWESMKKEAEDVEEEGD